MIGQTGSQEQGISMLSQKNQDLQFSGPAAVALL